MTDIHPIISAWRRILHDSKMCASCGTTANFQNYVISRGLISVCEACIGRFALSFALHRQIGFDDFEIYLDPDYGYLWEH